MSDLFGNIIACFLMTRFIYRSAAALSRRLIDTLVFYYLDKSLYSMNKQNVRNYKTNTRTYSKTMLNPYLTNEFSHHYQLGESTFIFRGVTCRCDFYFLSHFSMKFLCTKRIGSDGTPRSAASHPVLFCLSICPIKRTDARLIRVNRLHQMAHLHCRIDS